MSVLQIYRRVLAMLASDRRLAIVLGLANVVVAGLQFLDPLLFGRVVGLLSSSDRLPRDRLWHGAAVLIGVWLAVGTAGSPPTC